MELLEKSFDLFLERKVEHGMELGREQGATEKAIEIARNLIKKEMPVEDIAEVSQLSVEELSLL